MQGIAEYLWAAYFWMWKEVHKITRDKLQNFRHMCVIYELSNGQDTNCLNLGCIYAGIYQAYKLRTCSSPYIYTYNFECLS